MKLGTSSFITQMTLVTMILVCNMMLVKYGTISSYGADVPIAIMGIESKVFTVVINLTVGIALGCQPIISYNMGARKFDRVKQVHKSILVCTIVISAIATLLFQFTPNAIVGLFGAPANIPNPDAYWLFGGKIFRVFHSLVILTCIIKVTSIFFQAAGKPVYAVISSMVRDIVCFIPLILILPRFFGIEGILYAAPCADLIAGVLVVILTSNFVKSLENTKQDLRTKEAIKKSEKGVIVTITTS